MCGLFFFLHIRQFTWQFMLQNSPTSRLRKLSVANRLMSPCIRFHLANLFRSSAKKFASICSFICPSSTSIISISGSSFSCSPYCRPTTSSKLQSVSVSSSSAPFSSSCSFSFEAGGSAFSSSCQVRLFIGKVKWK